MILQEFLRRFGRHVVDGEQDPVGPPELFPAGPAGAASDEVQRPDGGVPPAAGGLHHVPAGHTSGIVKVHRQGPGGVANRVQSPCLRLVP